MHTMQEIFRRWRRYTGDVKATLGGHVLNLKILESPREHQTGFMGKPEPDTTFGLYFLYPSSAVRGFWMKNVPFDLDIEHQPSEEHDETGSNQRNKKVWKCLPHDDFI